MDEQTAVESRRGEKYGGRSRLERATDRKERILASALELFGTRDYDEVTVADVCAGARVSKRYFYEHFTDRADLVWELHGQQNRWLLRGVAEAVPPHPKSLEDFLRPAVTTLLTTLRDHPHSARVIYIIAPRMETRRRGVMHEDATFLGAMRQRATGHHPTDQARYDRMLLAMVAGLSEVIIAWLSDEMADDVDELTDHLTSFCLAVLSALPV